MYLDNLWRPFQHPIRLLRYEKVDRWRLDYAPAFYFQLPGATFLDSHGSRSNGLLSIADGRFILHAMTGRSGSFSD